jgi:hypothetical protein
MDQRAERSGDASPHGSHAEGNPRGRRERIDVKILLGILLALGLAAQAARADDIPRPDPRTLLEQPPLPSLQMELTPPKPGIVHRVFDKKFAAVLVADIVVSVVATKKLKKCRADHGIGPCADGGYGEFTAREILRQIQTGAVSLLSWKIKTLDDRDGSKYKFWWLFPAANAAWNAGGIIQNATKHNWPPRDKDKT